jgi:phospholipid/cholesterol/gamma-HCH transport system substrate-binding protein
MTRNRVVKLVLAAVLVAALVGGVAVVIRQTLFRPTDITAYFSTATAVYPGDEVRIAGVKVGTIESIKPVGTQAEMTLRVDDGIRIPADAKAVLVAQNLVSARYVQLTPAYESGPAMSNGAVIPIERTAVPVEWNEVKEQLTRLATELGPDNGMSTGSVGRFIDSAANAMDGNGEKLRQTLAQLSGVGRILADGSGNIVDTISNLQTFVTALRDSNEQIVQFQNRFATLTSVVDDSRSDLDAALKNLSDVVGETTRFINGTRDQTAEQIQRLANVTQTVADNRMSLENVLHIAPHSIANAVNMFDPRTGAASGVFVFNNLSNPDWAICGMIGALENVTAPTTSKLCSQYLGPALRTATMNNLPFPVNPFLTSNPPPYMLRYSEPSLMPGATGEASPEAPPVVSAFTGLNGDVPPPPGYGPPPGPPPGAPPPAAPASPTLQDMLLPAEGPPMPSDVPTPPPPSDGTPP